MVESIEIISMNVMLFSILFVFAKFVENAMEQYMEIICDDNNTIKPTE